MRSLDTDTPQSWLTWFFRGLLVLGFFILFARLAELQVIKGEYFRTLAEGNRVRRVSISAPRGKIFDRNGELLVDNTSVQKTVVFDPSEGYEKILANEETAEDEIITEWQRKYINGTALAHLSGYLGEVNENELDKVDPSCPEKGVRGHRTALGRGGLEQYYDCHLRGIDGEELVEVDTKGNRVRTLGRKQAVSGSDLKTTLDYKLQKKAQEVMKDAMGVLIVTTPKGEVLTLVSSPSFDVNNTKNISNLFTDKSLPLFNRAIGGLYHPGSIFKSVTTVAAVENGKIDSDYRYEDTGVIKIDEFEYNNWYFTQYGALEGVVDPVRAMARSTDTFYYKVGELVGPDAISDWATKFGLSGKTGIDLPGEMSGLVPNPEWKKATKGERWFLGNTYHMAIGQGDLSVTPIEAHRIASRIAVRVFYCQTI